MEAQFPSSASVDDPVEDILGDDSPTEAPKSKGTLEVLSSFFSLFWDWQHEPHWKNNFISVLTCAQQHGIDFLGITWQEAPGVLAKGAQSSIFQSVAAAKEHLVFKTMSPSWRRGFFGYIDPKVAQAVFRELLVQILILGHRALRFHPNILTLEGLSWEIQDPQKPESAVWPVLVFEKTELKHLGEFVLSEAPELDLLARLGLCEDIAAGLIALHANNAAHLDLKPDNILIFKNDADSGYTAKLSDFGLSTILSSTKKTRMRKANEWSAPENDENREYDSEQVKKIETYIFGLICVWILFLEDLANLEKNTSDPVTPKEGEGQRPAFHCSFLGLKALRNAGNDALLKFVATSVERAGLDTETSSRLSFLQKVLLERPEERVPISEAGFAANRDSHNMMSVESRPLGLTSPGFQISQALPALCRADFRVRRFVVDQLKKLSENDQAPVKQRTNAALQIVLCKRLGFAAPVDDSAAASWLRQKGHNLDSIEEMVQQIKSAKKNQVFTSSRLQYLYDDGIITPILATTQFKRLPDFHTAEKMWTREAEEMQQALGPTHPAVMNLKWNLETILIHSGKDESSPERLGKLLEEMAADLAADPDYGEESFELAAVQSDLAIFYLNTAQVKKGEDMCRKTYDLLLRLRGEKAILTCMMAGLMGEALLNRFQSTLALQLLETSKKVLLDKFGKTHYRTMQFRKILASIHLRLGELQEARTMLKEALKDLRNIAEEHDEIVVDFKMQTVFALEFSGKASEAEKVVRDMKASIENALRESKTASGRYPPPQMLNYILGSLLLAQDKYKEAAESFDNARSIFDSLYIKLSSPPPSIRGMPYASSSSPSQSSKSDEPGEPDRGLTPEDFPYHVPIVQLLISQSIALQAQSKAEDNTEVMHRASKDIGMVFGALNKVLGKQTWPDSLESSQGIDGSYIHHAMKNGWCGSLELLLTLGANNAREGLHYDEAIKIAKHKKLKHIAAVLDEHQVLCSCVPGAPVQDLGTLREFFTGKWEGNYLSGRPAAPGFRMDKFAGRQMTLEARPHSVEAKTLVVTGTGRDDMGDVRVEGEAWLDGKFVLYFGVGEGDVRYGWQYSGTVNLSRRVIGGTWSMRASTVPMGTYKDRDITYGGMINAFSKATSHLEKESLVNA